MDSHKIKKIFANLFSFGFAPHVERKKSNLRHFRKLRMEQLEDRQLLSVSTLEYAQLRETYSDLLLPSKESELNIIEFTANELSVARLKEAIASAEASATSDLIVLRTDTSNYQLNLGSEAIRIDANLEQSGTMTIVSIGPNLLQIASTSADGVFSVKEGVLQLGGFAVIGLSGNDETSTENLVTLGENGLANTDSVLFLTRNSIDAGNFSFNDVLNTVKGTAGLDCSTDDAAASESISLLGSNAYYAALPKSLSSNATSFATGSAATPGAESWSVDFEYEGTERAFLNGVSTEQALQLLTGTSTWKTPVFYDAEKTMYDDTLLCWAATSANMLRYTGWGIVGGMTTEDDILAYFNSKFNDASSNCLYGNEWFITGEYGPLKWDDWAQPTGGGGFYPNVNYSDYGGWSGSNGFSTSTKRTTFVTKLKENNAIGLSLGWYESSGNRKSGHNITCWGYTYNTTYLVGNSSYLTTFFVSDSDDDKKTKSEDKPNTLKNYAIDWDSKLSSYYFTAYGNNLSTGGTFGILEDYCWLAQKLSAPTPTLAQDFYEANETSETAANLGTISGTRTISNLTIHNSTDVDFFKFQTSGVGTSAHYVQANFTHADGDVEMKLYDSADRVVLTSMSNTDNERISFENLAAGTYYIKVYAYSGATNRYSLSFNMPTTVVTKTINVAIAADAKYATVDLMSNGFSKNTSYCFVGSSKPSWISNFLLEAGTIKLTFAGSMTTSWTNSSAILTISNSENTSTSSRTWTMPVQLTSSSGVLFANIVFTQMGKTQAFLSAPALSVSSTTANSVTLNIESVANASGYMLQYATNSSFISSSTRSVTSGSNTIAGFSANTTYYFRVKAIGTGSYADSAYSSTRSATTTYNLPSTPTNVRIDNYNPTSKSGTITWTPVYGASPNTGYNISYYDTSNRLVMKTVRANATSINLGSVDTYFSSENSL